jgi:peptidoglycan/LPS O-acetylase OafA/YrhL
MSAPQSLAQPRAHRPDLDGIRALAILSVVLYHSGLPHLTGGFTGVDIFFVLSGFLIGGHIHAELRNGDFSYARFYQRRARRILPAFFAVLAFTLALAMVLLSPAEAAQLARSAFAATLSASNLLFCASTNYFAGRSTQNPLLMTWSLGVEEQFYLVVPLLLVLLARTRRGLLLPATLALSIVSFAFAWVASSTHPMLVFYLLPARAWELGAGVALAIAESRRPPHPLPSRWTNFPGLTGMALLLAPVFLLDPASGLPGPVLLPSVIGAVLLISAPASSINRGLLSSAPLVYVGKISYSFYLWHWPLLAFLHIIHGGDAPRSQSLAAIALAFAASVLSFHFIEQPFRRSRRSARPLLVRYGGTATASLAICAFIWSSHGLPSRFPALARTETAGESLSSDPCLAGYGRDVPNLSAACLENATAPQVLALWGDSHSAALAPGLRALALAQGYGFVQLGKASCMPAVGATHFVPRIPLLAAECLRFNRAALDEIRSNPRIRIVILSAEWPGYLYSDWQDGWLAADLAHARQSPTPGASRSLFVAGLAGLIDTLQASGKQVLVLRDTPTFAVDPAWRIRTRVIPARRVLAQWLRVHDATDPGLAAPESDPHAALANILLDEAISESKNAVLVDLAPALCNHLGQCLYRDGDKLFYGDANHLSPAGAVFAVRNLRLPLPTENAASAVLSSAHADSRSVARDSPGSPDPR